MVCILKCIEKTKYWENIKKGNTIKVIPPGRQNMSDLPPFYASILSLFPSQANLYSYKIFLQPFSLPCKEGINKQNQRETGQIWWQSATTTGMKPVERSPLKPSILEWQERRGDLPYSDLWRPESWRKPSPNSEPEKSERRGVRPCLEKKNRQPARGKVQHLQQGQDSVPWRVFSPNFLSAREPSCVQLLQESVSQDLAVVSAHHSGPSSDGSWPPGHPAPTAPHLSLCLTSSAHLSLPALMSLFATGFTVCPPSLAQSSTRAGSRYVHGFTPGGWSIVGSQWIFVEWVSLHIGKCLLNYSHATIFLDCHQQITLIESHLKI